MRLFKEKDKSTFKYWFAHWCAFQMVALNCGCWKPKYLLHDIEKPWLMLLWKDYPRVRAWHRHHSAHHLEHRYKEYDWEAMVIDWECSRFTKESAQKNAKATMFTEMKEFKEISRDIQFYCTDILKRLGLW